VRHKTRKQNSRAVFAEKTVITEAVSYYGSGRRKTTETKIEKGHRRN
jgi:hypothetical protein